MRSAEAAKNTAQMIDESVTNTQSGVKLNEQVLENLTEIRGHVEKVSQMMNDISAESNAQHKTIEMISDSIAQISDSTQQVAASSEEAASASEELAGQSQEMLGLIGTYELGMEFKKSHSAGSIKGFPKPKTGNHQVKFKTNGTAKKNGHNGKGMGSPFAAGDSLIPFDDFSDSSLNEF
jgi:uncharacterized protein YoxC